jgi:hypothetical protein
MRSKSKSINTQIGQHSNAISVAVRLAGVDVFGIAHAGKPNCYGAMYTDQM